MVYLRWQLKYTSGWIEAPGVSSDCLFFWKSRRYRVIVLWTATQAQRDHKIIHARNFRVQPQAIMGSSIVEYVSSGRLADVGDVGVPVHPS